MSGSGSTEIANTVNLVVLAGVVSAICYAMMRIDGADLFPVAPQVAAGTGDATPVKSSAADQKLIDALMRLMADERIYRHDNVTIGTLATRLGIPEYRSRRLINQRLGYRNFNVFLNEHRIAEAKAALADPSQAEVPVITIAMDAGFQSLGPFNRAAKATTGVTPTGNGGSRPAQPDLQEIVIADKFWNRRGVSSFGQGDFQVRRAATGEPGILPGTR